MEQISEQPTADVVVTRVVDAPVERAWRAWTDPDDVAAWWGPAGFTASVAAMDVREGGVSLVSMRGPEGPALWNTWEYNVVRPGERLEFVMNFADAQGRRITPAEAGLPPAIPQDVHHVVEFASEADGRTRVTVTEHGYEPGPVRDVSQAGQEQVMDKYAALLSA